MARKSGAVRHTHKYYKAEDGLWYCGMESCTHFMPRNVAHQVAGKLSKCWECEKEFNLTKTMMELDKPLCPACRIGIDEGDLDRLLREKGLA